jgi:hypothetical protein
MRGIRMRLSWSRKGCLYLKRLDDVDLEVLQELVERTLRVHRGADRESGS